MFGFGKKTATKLEVEKAMEERDALLEAVGDAVEQVDELKDELLEEYRRANGRQ